MKVSWYVVNYTSGKRITFTRIIDEVKELMEEIKKGNKEGIHEETQDVFHFLQLWLYWQFKIDGDIWKITQDSVNKFMARRKVWEKIYEFVGLDKNVSKFCGNYEREYKVIKHLSEFGISESKAKLAFEKIVGNK